MGRFWAAADETGMSSPTTSVAAVVTNTARARMRELAEAGGRRMAFDMGLGNGGDPSSSPSSTSSPSASWSAIPNIRFVLAESGTGWIPFVVQEMDYRYEPALERRDPDNRPIEGAAQRGLQAPGLGHLPAGPGRAQPGRFLWRGSHDVGFRLPAPGQHLALVTTGDRNRNRSPRPQLQEEDYSRKCRGPLRALGQAKRRLKKGLPQGGPFLAGGQETSVARVCQGSAR